MNINRQFNRYSFVFGRLVEYCFLFSTFYGLQGVKLLCTWTSKVREVTRPSWNKRYPLKRLQSARNDYFTRVRRSRRLFALTFNAFAARKTAAQNSNTQRICTSLFVRDQPRANFHESKVQRWAKRKRERERGFKGQILRRLEEVLIHRTPQRSTKSSRGSRSLKFALVQ